MEGMNNVGFEPGGVQPNENALKNGLFYKNLVKKASQIKESRAESLTEDLEFAYRTKIELVRRRIRELNRQIEDSLDLFPNNITSLELAKNFDASNFVENDVKTVVEIRNLSIELQIAESRYKLLTGKDI